MINNIENTKENKGDNSQPENSHNAEGNLRDDLGKHIETLAQSSHTANRHDDEAKVTALSHEGFPVEVQQFIDECVGVYGTHKDLWVGAVIGASATAIGQSAILVTKYENSPLLWIALVSPSGFGKTEPINVMYKVLHKFDEEQYKAYIEILKDYELKQKDLPKNSNFKHDKPVPVQSIVIDITPEALGIAHDHNKKGITILREELLALFRDFDRYSRSGEQQSLLSSWSQQPYKVSRVSRSPIYIQQPFISILGGIQTKVLSEMAKDGRDDNGFLPRFCFVFPDNMQAPKYSKKKLSESTIKKIEEYYTCLHNRTAFRESFTLSAEAELLYETFYNKNKAIINSSLNDLLSAFTAKLDIIVLRLALTLHLSHSCYGKISNAISPETMYHAIQIAEYFRYTSNKVVQLIGQKLPKNDIAKTLHKEYNMSQMEIAKIFKVSQPRISKILKK